MDKIRLATEQEVEGVRTISNLCPPYSVFAFDGQAQPDLAVYRMAPELDPVMWAPETSDRRKMLFIWAIENGLRMMGTVPHYYFQVSAEDTPEATKWRHVVETSGAERLSPTPQYRYIKSLL